MANYENLTKILDKLKNNEGKYGDWAKQPPDADGSLEHPYHMDYVIYSNTVECLIKEIYTTLDNYPEFNSSSYIEFCKEKGLDTAEKMLNSDNSNQDIRTCLMQLLSII